MGFIVAYDYIVNAGVLQQKMQLRYSGALSSVSLSPDCIT